MIRFSNILRLARSFLVSAAQDLEELVESGEIDEKRVSDLKKFLKAEKLPLSGKKPVLLKRLRDHVAAKKASSSKKGGKPPAKGSRRSSRRTFQDNSYVERGSDNEDEDEDGLGDGRGYATASTDELSGEEASDTEGAASRARGRSGSTKRGAADTGDAAPAKKQKGASADKPTAASKKKKTSATDVTVRITVPSAPNACPEGAYPPLRLPRACAPAVLPSKRSPSDDVGPSNKTASKTATKMATVSKKKKAPRRGNYTLLTGDALAKARIKYGVITAKLIELVKKYDENIVKDPKYMPGTDKLISILAFWESE